MITALPLEADTALEHLTDIREEVHEAGTIYRVGVFVGLKHEWEVATVTTGMHNVAAGIETERIIEHFRPSVVLFSGVAGGLTRMFHTVKRVLEELLIPSNVHGHSRLGEAKRAADSVLGVGRGLTGFGRRCFSSDQV